jgi:hypothetical protein
MVYLQLNSVWISQLIHGSHLHTFDPWFPFLNNIWRKRYVMNLFTIQIN